MVKRSFFAFAIALGCLLLSAEAAHSQTVGTPHVCVYVNAETDGHYQVVNQCQFKVNAVFVQAGIDGQELMLNSAGSGNNSTEVPNTKVNAQYKIYTCDQQYGFPTDTTTEKYPTWGSDQANVVCR